MVVRTRSLRHGHLHPAVSDPGGRPNASQSICQWVRRKPGLTRASSDVEVAMSNRSFNGRQKQHPRSERAHAGYTPLGERTKPQAACVDDVPDSNDDGPSTRPCATASSPSRILSHADPRTSGPSEIRRVSNQRNRPMIPSANNVAR